MTIMQFYLLNFGLLAIFLVDECFSVQIDSDGTVDYCNTNPSQFWISFLGSNDSEYISKIEQVQIFTRHGTRTTTSSLTNYFSQDIVSSYNMKFDCDIKTDTNRFVAREFENRKNSSHTNDYITVRANYISNSQQVEGNCEAGQSVSDLLMQHRINGELLYDRYIATNINNTKEQIMNDSILADIVNNIYKNNFDSRLIVHSTNYERTLASATVLISSLFKKVSIENKNNSNTNYDGNYNSSIFDMGTVSGRNLNWNINLVLDIIATTKYSTPYLPRDNWKIGDKLDDYIDSIVKDDNFYNLWNSDEIQLIRDEYQRITNITLSQHTGISILPAYCAGIELPFNKSFFNKLIDIGNTFNQLQWFNKWNMYNDTHNSNNSSNSTDSSLFDRNQAYVLASSPMRYLIGQYILNMTNNGEYERKIVYHSFHDSSIYMLLAGLGIGDGMTPIFAQMLQLEIYSIKDEYSSKNLFPSGYAFRFLRNGQNNLLKFSKCGDMYEMGSQLCDLNVLLDILNEKSMELHEWQDYTQAYLTRVFDDTDNDNCVLNDSIKTKYMMQGVWIGAGITALFFLITCIMYNIFLFKRMKKGFQSWQKLENEANSTL